MVETHAKRSTRQTHERWCTESRRGNRSQHEPCASTHIMVLPNLELGTLCVSGRCNKCRNVVSMDLTSQWQPMATRLLPHMLERASDHDGTIRWSACHNFSRVVLVGRRQAQMDHRRCVRPMYAGTTCVVKTTNVAQQAKTRKTANTASAWDTAYGQGGTTNTWAPRPTCRDVASTNLTDRCWPMAARSVL